ncbi:MAG: hypothetical protein AAFN79_05830 [Pseudomonadota bacterium]
MSDLPVAAFLWIGGSLSWMEQLCVKSFVNKGHPTVLYTYGDVGEVPEGVEVRDGREVLSDDYVVSHGRTQSFALFSDIFRYHLMMKKPGEIWVDTDMLCWKSLENLDPVVVGYEAHKKLNGAILRLPPDSESLREMIEFTNDEYSIPPFVSRELQDDYRAAHEDGAPVHVSEMPWGIWGPLAITYFLKKTGEAKFAAPEAAYYPVHFKDRKLFFKRPTAVMRTFTEETRTIHLWARRTKRFVAKRHSGKALDDNFLGWAMREHDVPFDEGVLQYETRKTFVPVETPDAGEKRPSMTELAERHQTDKGFSKHRYTLLYDMLFQGLRDRDLNIMELGLQAGGPEQGAALDRETTDAPSLRMLLDYFPKAEVIGVDVSDFSWIDSDRFTFVKCDMENREEIAAVAADAPALDIVIDDASHASRHQQMAFLELFPKLKSGGFYIIESLNWQPPIYEDADDPKTIRTVDLFNRFREKGRFTHPDTALSAKLNRMRGDIASAFVFQHHFKKDEVDKLLIIHKA